MTSAESPLEEIELPSYGFDVPVTDEWLGDAFYREYKEVPTEPKGIIPQDWNKRA